MLTIEMSETRTVKCNKRTCINWIYEEIANYLHFCNKKRRENLKAEFHDTLIIFMIYHYSGWLFLEKLSSYIQ